MMKKICIITLLLMLHCVTNVFAAEVNISYNEDNNDYVIIKGKYQ